MAALAFNPPPLTVIVPARIGAYAPALSVSGPLTVRSPSTM